MGKISVNVWRVVVKVIIAVATTVLAALGVKDDDDVATR